MEYSWFSKPKFRQVSHFLKKIRSTVLCGVLLSVMVFIRTYGNTVDKYGNTADKYDISRSPRSVRSPPVTGPLFILILCEGSSEDKRRPPQNAVGRQIKQSNILIKSALALTSVPLRFVVVSDTPNMYQTLLQTTLQWPKNYRDNLRLEYRPVWYPEGRENMRNMFRPCATERLFLTETFEAEDAAVYIDTDFIFMTPPEEIWEEFEYFDAQQLAAMAPCLFHYDNPKRNKVPFYGITGLNAGIMHMNFTRMKVFPEGGWIEANMRVFDEYKSDIVLADQDILNILFNKYPEKLYELSCKFNYRAFQCFKGTNKCPITAVEGVSMLHGNAMAFVKDKERKFQVIMEAWQQHQLGTPIASLYTTIIEKLQKVNTNNENSSCKSLLNIDSVLTKRLREYVENSL